MTSNDKQNDGKSGNRVPVISKEALRGPLPKRFYKTVSLARTENGYSVLLDGRGIKTPGKRPLQLPTEALAQEIAAEWAAQEELIDPGTMPLTRIANSAIDAVALNFEAVAQDIAAYAASDLLCYRAEHPDELIRRQQAAWDPILGWARTRYDIHFNVVRGIVPVEQPAGAHQRVLAALEGTDPLSLSALHVMTTLTGSALLALALASGAISREAAWAAAHVDEDWQIERWGEDFEASERRRLREAEFRAASRLAELIR